MMNKLIKMFSVIFIFASLSYSCDDDVSALEPPTVPTDVSVIVDIPDNSGRVIFTPTASNVFFFEIQPGGGAQPVQVQPGQSATVRYNGIGTLTFNATIIAFSTGGVSSSITQEVEVTIDATNDPQLLSFLAGGETNSSRRWVWDSGTGGVDGHFGVGDPNPDVRFPNFFAADANGLSDPDCIYGDVLEFSVDENGASTYNLITGGDTFVNWEQVTRFFPEATPAQFVDECRELDSFLTTETSFLAFNNEAGVSTFIPGGGLLSPLSYYANVAEWEILELSDEVFRVRGVNAEGTLAWYHQFIPEDNQGDTGGRVEAFDQLIFSDEFDVNGAPDPSVWNFDLGTGCPNLCGWGNDEAQFYTDRSENITVQDGILRITARRENFGSGGDAREFTSARINTFNKFEFTFGRVDFRARLPSGGGTWVATWMLGADFETNIWPGAGEIDVMEHVGNQTDRIFGTTHSPAGFGGTAIGGDRILSNATNEFHVYSVDWTETFVKFYIDDELYFTYEPSVINEETFPFDSDFFLLINFAMGGTFGGNIDSGFAEEVFEIDYVRVYQ